MSEWCDDCAWPEACAKARECARREAGEVRSAATPEECNRIRCTISGGAVSNITVHDAQPAGLSDDDRRRCVVIHMTPPRRRA